MDRQRRLVWAVRFVEWKEVRQKVDDECNGCDPSDDARHGSVERVEVDNQAGKEDAEGDMHEDGKESNDDGDLPSLQAHVAELANPTTVARSAGRDGHVLVDPLLGQYSHQRCGQTERQAREPQSVHPDSRLRWPNSRKGRELRTGDFENRQSSSSGSVNVDRFVHEVGVDFREIGFETLAGLSDEGGDDGGEESSLAKSEYRCK